MEPSKQQTKNAEELKQLVEKLREVCDEIYEIQTSTASRSHAGPTLALRSLKRQKEILEKKIELLK